MHVLGITDHLGNVGGAEISANTILTGLAERDEVDRVTVVGIDDPNKTQLDFGKADIIPVEPPPAVSDLPDFIVDLLVERRLAHAAERIADDVDIIHAHHRRSSLSLAHLDVSVPTVATVRDFWPACPISIYHVGGDRCTGCGDRLDECVAHQGWDGLTEPGIKAYLLAKRRHQRPTLGQVDCAVFIANHLRDRLTEDIALPERTPTIYNPVEIDANAEPEDFEDPTFVTASSLTESKGIETAIRALGHLVENHTDAQLVVFGDGPLRADLEDLAEKVAPGVVDFRGRVDPEEVYAGISGALATVFPSVWDEPFGRITVESMALGTPVVGSAVGGIAEVIDDGETGLLFPPGDVVALTDKMQMLYTKPEYRKQLAAAGRERVSDFSRDRIVNQHLSLYAELTNSISEK